MRRSKVVTLAVVPLFAAAFAGCGEEERGETAYCTDADGVVVENVRCDEEAGGGGGLFFWYFGGFGGRSITQGTRLGGGERIAASDSRALAAKGGGFGSSARGSGGSIGRPGGSSGGG